MTLVLSEAVAPGGGGYMAVPAGEHIVVPAGTAHTFWNPSSEPARYDSTLLG
jgi:mannose-6-phosphate isomerase-like protein (cupin superfamily)